MTFKAPRLPPPSHLFELMYEVQVTTDPCKGSPMSAPCTRRRASNGAAAAGYRMPRLGAKPCPPPQTRRGCKSLLARARHHRCKTLRRTARLGGQIARKRQRQVKRGWGFARISGVGSSDYSDRCGHQALCGFGRSPCTRRSTLAARKPRFTYPPELPREGRGPSPGLGPADTRPGTRWNWCGCRGRHATCWVRSGRALIMRTAASTRP